MDEGLKTGVWAVFTLAFSSKNPVASSLRSLFSPEDDIFSLEKKEKKPAKLAVASSLAAFRKPQAAARLPFAQEKIMAEKAERQKEIDLRRKQRKAEELDTQPYISAAW